jgi:hypothetical protein
VAALICLTCFIQTHSHAPILRSELTTFLIISQFIENNVRRSHPVDATITTLGDDKLGSPAAAFDATPRLGLDPPLDYLRFEARLIALRTTISPLSLSMIAGKMRQARYPSKGARGVKFAAAMTIFMYPRKITIGPK